MTKYNKLHTTTRVGSALFGLSLLLSVSATASDYRYPSYGSYPENAHQACKRNEDSRQIVSGVLGAVAGGVIGSQVAGSGARTEGSAIGAVIGGLAGAGLADKMIDCDPVYTRPTSYYPQTNGYYSDRTSYGSYPGYSSQTYGSGTYQQGYGYSNNAGYLPPGQYRRRSYGNSHHGYTVASTRPAYVRPVTYTQSYSSQTYSSPAHYHGSYVCREHH